MEYHLVCDCDLHRTQSRELGKEGVLSCDKVILCFHCLLSIDFPTSRRRHNGCTAPLPT